MSPQTLTIHSTANLKSTAQNERDNLARIDNKASVGFHIVVDEKEAIECVPLNEIAWHAGDGYNGMGNRTSIGLEICESGNRQKTIDNVVVVTAKILKERGWGVDRLRRHYDWSKKSCPRILMADNWKLWHDFVKRVKIELEV